jgi:hypothetical protein
MQKRLVRCRCGAVEIEIEGAPIVTAACHCDDCQAGAALLLERGGISVLDRFAGTPSVLFRKDRVHVLNGAGRIEKLKLRPSSRTNRTIATCFGTPLMVTFDSALHWVPVYSQLFGSAAPPLEMRLNTRFIPPDIPAPTDVPSYRYFPLSFAVRLVGARIAMALGR